MKTPRSILAPILPFPCPLLEFPQRLRRAEASPLAGAAYAEECPLDFLHEFSGIRPTISAAREDWLGFVPSIWMGLAVDRFACPTPNRDRP